MIFKFVQNIFWCIYSTLKRRFCKYSNKLDPVYIFLHKPWVQHDVQQTFLKPTFWPAEILSEKSTYNFLRSQFSFSMNIGEKVNRKIGNKKLNIIAIDFTTKLNKQLSKDRVTNTGYLSLYENWRETECYGGCSKYIPLLQTTQLIIAHNFRYHVPFRLKWSNHEIGENSWHSQSYS